MGWEGGSRKRGHMYTGWSILLYSFSSVTQSCLTLSDPVDWSLPGSSTHGIFQARALEWGAIAFSTMQETLVQFLGPEDPLEKKKATCSNILAWKNPMDGGAWGSSMGSLRVGHNWATSLSLFTFMHWRRQWQPTPVFLPGEFQGQGSLVGCRFWDRTKSDTTEVT